jgi:flagellin-like hook-associated protein FlgL
MPMPLSGLAQTLSNSVASVQQQIVDTQDQLASGVKNLNPAQNGVVTRLSAQADGYGQVLTNIGTAQSVISVGQGALASITSIMTQMKSLATQATSAGLTISDTQSLNATFSNLAAQVSTLQSGASVNGNSVLNGATGITVTTGIDGSSSAQTSVTGVDVTSIYNTIKNLSITATSATNATVTSAQAGVSYSSGTAGVSTITMPTGGFASGADGASTVTISDGTNVITIANKLSTTASPAVIAAALAAYITNGVVDTTNFSAISATTGSLPAFQAKHTVTVDSNNRLVFTQTAAGTTGPDTLTVGGLLNTSSTVTTNTIGVASAAGTQATDKVVFTALNNGNSVTVGGLTFTAGTGGSTADATALAFYNYIKLGTTPVSTQGVFSGPSADTMLATWLVGNNSGTGTGSSGYGTTAPSGTDTGAGAGTLYFKSVASAPSTLSATGTNNVTNAQAAIVSLTTQLNTASTGQSTLAAGATGLAAQSSNATALKTGLTNTVNSIQNIDATAMQAKLQQLNNQQSIDYYLVSQMNTEAAAILSIFR